MSELEEFASRTSYLVPVPYLNGTITEYDMKAANISSLRYANLIDDQTYRYLKNLPKQDREVTIGKMLKGNPNLYYEMQKVISYAKFQLLSKNNIPVQEVVRIANDAIYILSDNMYSQTTIDDDGILYFATKNRFTSMLTVCKNLLIFANTANNGLVLDVKGINDELLFLHEPMLGFIGELIIKIESNNTKEIISYFKDFYSRYMNRKLDLSYYRELNSDSMYRHSSGLYLTSTATDIDSIDIGFNAYILRDIWNTILHIINQHVG